jgi:HlyD family secretion protein
VNNVVNYTAVVAVGNPDGKLLPGMTATVKFLTGSASNALSVPNAALRFKPAIAAGDSASTGKRTRSTVRNVSAGATPDSTRAVRDATMATLWYLDSTNAIKPVRVRAGLSDGTRTQVTGTGVTQGMQIIVGASTGTSAATATTTNPLQQQSTNRRGGGGAPGPF